MMFDHLSDKTKGMLDQPLAEKLAYVQKDSWIPYPAADEILKRMDDLLNHPRCDRMPNMAICARTNNGKTRLIKHFLNLHPPSDNIAGGAVDIPVLYIQCPGIPDEGRLYDALLTHLFTGFRPSASAREKLRILLGLLPQIGIKVLAIDEVNYAESGSMDRQKVFLNALRYLAGECQISIVMLGTEEMMRVIRTVPSFENRTILNVLPPWKCDNDFRRLLASFEQLIPLPNPSRLSSKRFASLLHSRSEGTIGELKLLLGQMADLALRSGQGGFTEELVERCGYKSPSVRRREKIIV